MRDNNEPLEFRNATDTPSIMQITEKTANRIVLQADVESQHYSDLSIGALLSEDRQIVYWVNTTNPLP